MKRALTPQQLIDKKIDAFEFTEEWKAAFGCPAKRGVWFIWGKSGNGKTSLLLQLAKEIARSGERVLFNSLEEGDGDTMKQAFIQQRMTDIKSKVLLIEENIEALSERLSKPKSPKVVIIDSIQYCRFNKKKFEDFVQRFQKTHLIVFNSQARGKEPRGTIAETAQYHAVLKIWVEGFRAFSNGRYYGPEPYYTIWYEKAIEYWLTE